MKANVSIIVAVYNIESLIDRCVESLMNQSMKNIEIILVNDASTDRSLEVCEKYANIDRRIRIIDKKVNKGLSEARNTGLQYANGEYVAFVDGDDYLDLKAYEKAYKLAKRNDSDMVVFGSYFEKVDGSRQLMPITSARNTYTKLDKNQFMYEMIGTLPDAKSDYDIGFSPWGKICKLELIQSQNIRFTSERKIIYEDLMFALDFYPCVSNISICNEPLYFYCENKNSLTQKVDLKKFYRIKEMYSYLLSNPRYSTLLLKDGEMTLRFKRTMIGYIRLCIIQSSQKISNLKIIKNICKDEMCKEILSEYPIKQLPVKQRIFAYLIKMKMPLFLYMICKVNGIGSK